MPSVSNQTYGALVDLPVASEQDEKGRLVEVTMIPVAPNVEYSSTYTGSGWPTLAEVALCVSSPRRTTMTDVVANSDTTLELVDVCVGVVVGVVVFVPVFVGVVVCVEVVVDDGEGVTEGEAVAVIPNELDGDAVLVALGVFDGEAVVEGEAVFVGVVDADGVCEGVTDDEGVTAALGHAGLYGTPLTPRNSEPGAGVATTTTEPPLGRAYRAVGVVASSVKTEGFDRL